jgi:hypothetical protein
MIIRQDLLSSHGFNREADRDTQLPHSTCYSDRGRILMLLRDCFNIGIVLFSAPEIDSWYGSSETTVECGSMTAHMQAPTPIAGGPGAGEFQLQEPRRTHAAELFCRSSMRLPCNLCRKADRSKASLVLD